ncbi:MAG: tetratricopeptide repeat protein [Planctomycetes bacterium]|nr:tetratricopeptide repeat protein [Planctomycetota bacterium]
MGGAALSEANRSERGGSTDGRALWRVLITVFTVALAVRVAALVELSRVDPYFATPVVDELTNTQEAIRIARGDPMTAPFWKPPLYPHVLALTLLADPPNPAAVYRTLPSPWIPKGAQAVIDAATAAMIALLALRLANRASGWVAGLLYAFSFTPVYYVAQILDTTLFTALCIGALLLFDRARRQDDAVGWLLGGITLGVAAAARAPALFFVPVALLLPWLRRAKTTDAEAPVSISRLALHSAAILFGTIAAVLPVTLSNWKFGHDRVLISSNGGINFYIGNRPGDEPGADGLTSVNAGPRWRALLKEVDPSLAPSERSRRYYALAFRAIESDLGGFVAKLGRKAIALFDAYEIPNNKNFVEERGRSWVLTLLPGRTAIIFSMGIVGLIFLGKRLRGRLALAGFALTQALGIVAFFVAARYRVPILAVSCIPAGAWLATAFIERTRFPRLVPSILVAVGLLVLTHSDPLGLESRFESYVVDPLALAHAQEYLAQERPQERAEHSRAAEELYRRALVMDPHYPEVSHNLALRALAEGNLPEAERLCRRAVEGEDDAFAEGWNTLGQILLARGENSEARAAFDRALRIDPTYSKAYASLGQLLEAQQNIEMAYANYQLARKYDPSETLYFILEARALGKKGEPERGLRLLEETEARLEVPPQRREILEDVRAQLIDRGRRQDPTLLPPELDPAGPDEQPDDG